MRLRTFQGLILVNLLLPLPTTACSCVLIESFCEAVQHGKDWSSQMTLAVRGIKMADVPVDDYRTDMIFEITESYYNPMALKVVKVLDGNGASCTRPVHQHQIGEELILHLWLHMDSTEILGSISSCQPPPLEVEGETVTGVISSGIERLSLNQFRRIMHCGFENKMISIFPNPASESIDLSYLDQSTLSGTTILIVNAMGQQVYEGQISEIDVFIKSIPISDLAPGVYFLRSNADGIVADTSFLVIH